MPDYLHEHQPPDTPATVSISIVVRTLRAYLPIISLAMAAVAVGYLIVALAIYILAPASRVTSLAFRLEFDGADRGEYPNGTKFSPTEILSTPVLLKTFNSNNLGRFTTFSNYTTSVFVLQSNAAQDALSREYQARLSEVRLSAVDRERLQREYELKLGSLSKDQYAIHYVRKGGDRDAVPDIIVRKVLHDILRNWSAFAANEQHVLEYRVAVLSPDVVAGTGGGTNPIVDTVMMRDKVQRLLFNIEQIRALPAAELAHTSDDLTLTDLAVRLDDVVRYRLDPLVNRIAAAGLDDRAETIRFLETQLAHDERRLGSQTRRADAAQRTLALFMNAPQAESTEAIAATAQAPARTPPESETVMPQISETFLDRLIQLTSHSVDTDFRKRLAEEFRTESLKVVPFQEAVAYDRDLLGLVRSSGRSSAAIDPKAVPATIASLRADLRGLAVKVREIHKAVSTNLNPATELVTTSAPSSRVERGTSLKSLAMYGLLTLALALPMIIIICLLHNHVMQEREEEQRLEEGT